MRRDDLPKEYDGWQVLDPTPQELSEGTFLLFDFLYSDLAWFSFPVCVSKDVFKAILELILLHR